MVAVGFNPRFRLTQVSFVAERRLKSTRNELATGGASTIQSSLRDESIASHPNPLRVIRIRGFQPTVGLV